MRFASGTGFFIQPGYLITNHHVVEGSDGLEILARRNQAVSYKGRLLAVSPAEDIALVECKELRAAPVSIDTGAPRLATDIIVLGYPETQRIGTDLKAVKGVISGLPDPTAGNMLLYDALINHGSSGGPVCDQRGRVVALNRAILLLENNISAGVPATSVLAFIKAELPKFEQPPEPAEKKEWADIADTVGESTVLIYALKAAIKPRAIAKAAPKRDDKGPEMLVLEDRWCMFCHGFGEVNCPNCFRGAATAMGSSVEGVEPSTGRPIIVTAPTKVRCSTCGGKGFIACTHCNGGIDPTVIGGKPRSSYRP